MNGDMRNYFEFPIHQAYILNELTDPVKLNKLIAEILAFLLGTGGSWLVLDEKSMLRAPTRDLIKMRKFRLKLHPNLNLGRPKRINEV